MLQTGDAEFQEAIKNLIRELEVVRISATWGYNQRHIFFLV